MPPSAPRVFPGPHSTGERWKRLGGHESDYNCGKEGWAWEWHCSPPLAKENPPPCPTRQCLLDTTAIVLWHSRQLWLSAQDKFWEAWSSQERSLIFQNSNFSFWVLLFVSNEPFLLFYLSWRESFSLKWKWWCIKKTDGFTMPWNRWFPWRQIIGDLPGSLLGLHISTDGDWCVWVHFYYQHDATRF